VVNKYDTVEWTKKHKNSVTTYRGKVLEILHHRVLFVSVNKCSSNYAPFFRTSGFQKVNESRVRVI